ncbi:MAG: gliding motility-associated C-terminal domain-containing protein [Bacteroidia bacterium]
MKHIAYLYFLFGVLVFLSSSLNANHVYGGGMQYRSIDQSQDLYEIEVVAWYNCNALASTMDDPIYLFRFAASGQSQGFYSIPLPVLPSPDSAAFWRNCVGNSTPPCILRVVYRDTILLPPVTGGWDLTWGTCCEVNSIANTGESSLTWHVHVPTDQFPNNSQARMLRKLPRFACAGEEFVFDLSANDLDQDSLSYRIVWPFTGENTRGLGAHAVRGSTHPFNPAGPPPYRLDQYATILGYSFQNPFGPGGHLKLDPQTGRLQVLAPQPGNYEWAFEVVEYRDGVEIGSFRWTLVLIVVPCSAGELPTWSGSDSAQVLRGPEVRRIAFHDTIAVVAGETLCYNRKLNGQDSSEVLTAYLLAPSRFEQPQPEVKVLGVNPVRVKVCFTPDCEQVGDTIPIILEGIARDKCLLRDRSYDTVWVRVLAPEMNIISTDSICLFDTAFVQGFSNTRRTIWTTGDTTYGNLFSSPISTQRIGAIPLGERGCVGDTVWTTVFVDPDLPVARFDLDKTEGVARFTVQANSRSKHAQALLWYTEDKTYETPAIKHTYNTPGTYMLQLKVRHRFGCEDSIQKQVVVVDGDIFLPNAFSPNGDGINDCFQAIGSGGLTGTISIYNRWGKRVFTSSNPLACWDGEGAPEGVYVVSLQVRTPGSRMIDRRGTIVLIR